MADPRRDPARRRLRFYFRATTQENEAGRGCGARSASRGGARAGSSRSYLRILVSARGRVLGILAVLVGHDGRDVASGEFSSHVRVDDETIFTAASRDEHPGRGPRAERPRRDADGRFDFDRAQLVGRARRTRCGTRRVQSAPPRARDAMSWRFSPTKDPRRRHTFQVSSMAPAEFLVASSALFSRGLSVRPAETYSSPCRSPCRSPSARAFPGHARGSACTSRSSHYPSTLHPGLRRFTTRHAP